MNVTDKLENTRRFMSEAGIDAYIVTGSDPHGSEIPPARWRTREWISGFTGSAGTVVVTADEAGLWTDFRYWIQAADELSGSGVDLHRDGADDALSLEDWLAGNLNTGSRVGIDGSTIPEKRMDEIETRLAKAGMTVTCDLAPWDSLWRTRPELPGADAVELGLDETGESRSEKLVRLRDALKREGADTWVGTALDSVAWLLNIRGGDVPFVPVMAAYAIADLERCVLYANPAGLPGSLSDALAEDGVTVEPYENFDQGLSSLEAGRRILLDPQAISRGVWAGIPENVERITGDDPVFYMKSVKNSVEAGNIARAMEKDGVAVVRFFIELEKRLGEGERLTEIEAADLLEEQRRNIPGFLGNSFSPIPAVGGHGAICHYEASEEGVGILESGDGLFLIDSGGQWEEGTTDITRTLSLGSPTIEQVRDYTLVLKSHVGLSIVRFPKGTRGYQLDALARLPLWMEGRDFGHGTGHGVGYRLNVHEGPQRLSTHPNDVAVVPGMVVSNEPGIYREGRYGIRIENLLICREESSNEFGTFHTFDTLTLAPYDSTLIDTGILTGDELEWINAYQAEVFRRLSPMLEPAEVDWLRHRTSELTR